MEHNLIDQSARPTSAFKLVQLALGVTATIALTFASFFASAPAFADSPPTATEQHFVDPNDVCVDQGASAASIPDQDPMRIRCVVETYSYGGTLGAGTGVSAQKSSTVTGGLDIQAWCSRNYPGSRTNVIWHAGYWLWHLPGDRAYDWVCES